MPSRSEKTKLAGTSVPGSLRLLQKTSLLIRATFLGVVVVMAAAVILPLGWAISGNQTGLVAGVAAGGVCLLAAWIALGLGDTLRKPQQILALVIVGMMTRMGIPLAAALIVYFCGGPLADAGFLYYLILFYPVTLTAETLLFLPERHPNEKNGYPAQDFVG
jgi:hypothetical protein